MTLIERSNVEAGFHKQRQIKADASARFICDLATIGMPMSLAGIKAAGDAAEAASFGRSVVRFNATGPSLIVTTPVGPCAPAV